VEVVSQLHLHLSMYPRPTLSIHRNPQPLQNPKQHN
jgi:hypothetical protein